MEGVIRERNGQRRENLFSMQVKLIRGGGLALSQRTLYTLSPQCGIPEAYTYLCMRWESSRKLLLSHYTKAWLQYLLVKKSFLLQLQQLEWEKS